MLDQSPFCSAFLPKFPLRSPKWSDVGLTLPTSEMSSHCVSESSGLHLTAVAVTKPTVCPTVMQKVQLNAPLPRVSEFASEFAPLTYRCQIVVRGPHLPLGVITYR